LLELTEFCSNGRDALDFIKESIDAELKRKEESGETGSVQPIQLLITDFKMPILNGASLVKELNSYVKKMK
jgi:CheY-like chemotaxis protein